MLLTSYPNKFKKVENNDEDTQLFLNNINVHGVTM